MIGIDGVDSQLRALCLSRLITGGTIEVGDGDSCYDVFVNGQGGTLEDFNFQENLRIPCLGDDATGTFLFLLVEWILLY